MKIHFSCSQAAFSFTGELDEKGSGDSQLLFNVESGAVIHGQQQDSVDVYLSRHSVSMLYIKSDTILAWRDDLLTVVEDSNYDNTGDYFTDDAEAGIFRGIAHVVYNPRIRISFEPSLQTWLDAMETEMARITSALRRSSSRSRSREYTESELFEAFEDDRERRIDMAADRSNVAPIPESAYVPWPEKGECKICGETEPSPPRGVMCPNERCRALICASCAARIPTSICSNKRRGLCCPFCTTSYAPTPAVQKARRTKRKRTQRRPDLQLEL